MEGLSLDLFLNQRVVLDTQGPMIYIGTLVAYSDRGYWLLDADVHDRSDGHSPKEVYINEARELERSGTRRTNRRRVFVERNAIISLSALDDVVATDSPSGAEE
jgi:small nuclear ribonucleoprotein (snRNP)-like protein